MDWNKFYFNQNEKPLDRMPEGISNTAIFRSIGFIGDSLSSGEFESRDANGNNGYHDYFEYSWGQYIARKNGLLGRNFSRGGMTAKEYWESFADANRYWSAENACQAYVIALGVNDKKHIQKGSIDDLKDLEKGENRETFASYYGRIIRRLKEIQPRAKFFLVTMPRGNDELDKERKEFNALLREIAEYFDNCYLIDLYEYGPVYDEEFKKRFYLYGHMNASGYIFTANIIDAYIDYIIRKNPEDFKYVPYIGTDLK